MGANHLVNWVFACISEFRGYAFVVEWRFQECLAQTIAFCIKVVVYIAVFKPKGLLPMARMIEVGCIDFADTDTYTIYVLFIVIHTNRIAFL